MASLNGFNAEDHKDEFQPIPAGRYTAAIIKSETKSTKDGKGSYLKLEIDILDGQYKGRKIFENLNLENANETTVKIAQVTLANICRAVGVLHPKDSSELHHKPMSVRVVIEPEKDGMPAQNRIKGWDAIGPAKAPESVAPANAKPWERPAPKPEETPTF